MSASDRSSSKLLFFLSFLTFSDFQMFNFSTYFFNLLYIFLFIFFCIELIIFSSFVCFLVCFLLLFFRSGFFCSIPPPPFISFPYSFPFFLILWNQAYTFLFLCIFVLFSFVLNQAFSFFLFQAYHNKQIKVHLVKDPDTLLQARTDQWVRAAKMQGQGVQSNTRNSS